MRIPNDVNFRFKEKLTLAAMQGNNVFENEFNKLCNLKVYRLHKVTVTDIFRNYWLDFLKAYPGEIRPSIIKTVDALIGCKDFSKGHLFYECPNCYNFHMTGFSCHARFCFSCGKKYRDARSINIQKKLINSPHRHFVFSIPYDLRPFFWKCRKLFDCLFSAVNDALLLSISRSRAEKRNDLRLGFVSFLHTSGRSLNIHPHLHVLLAEKSIDKFGNKKKIHYFPFKRLKKSFMYSFLSKANLAIKKMNDPVLYKEFNIVRSYCLRRYKDGFYVHGPANKKSKSYVKSSKETADYISRYASHPPISESNILSLDEDNHTITWTYTPHEDPDNPVIVTEHVFKFIAKLIRHIPDSKTHVLRYYGFYANRSSRRTIKSKRLFKVSFLNKLKTNIKWRIMIIKTYKYDPLLCSCGGIMTLNTNLSFYGKYDWRDFDE